MNKDDKSDITYPVKGKMTGITPDGKIFQFLQVRNHNPDFIKYENDWYIRCDSWILIPLDMTDEEVEAARERAKKWRSEH